MASCIAIWLFVFSKLPWLQGGARAGEEHVGVMLQLVVVCCVPVQ
jgi:hypothetical protein